MDTGSIYSAEFFAGQMDGSRRSAAVVVPLVLSLMRVDSVIDVGCGVGPWANEFLANGITDVWGVDGDYVSREQLQIPSTHFLPRDLTKPLSFGRTFDLAVCLEVAEHLPASRADGLVKDLVAAAPCVLFSAAVPGPTGTGHINSQFLPYWIEAFKKHNYEAIDPIRPQILGTDSVEWFYQQDIVMFASQGHPLLSVGFPKPQSFVHPVLYEQVLHMRRLGESSRRFRVRSIVQSVIVLAIIVFCSKSTQLLQLKDNPRGGRSSWRSCPAASCGNRSTHGPVAEAVLD